jgi:hypothetical protein
MRQLARKEKLVPVQPMQRLGEERSDSPDIRILEDEYERLAEKKNRRVSDINRVIPAITSQERAKKKRT